MLFRSFCFDHREHEVSGIAQEIVGSFGGPAARFSADDENAPVRKTLLLADLIVVPASGVKFREDVFSTSVGFGEHRNLKNSEYDLLFMYYRFRGIAFRDPEASGSAASHIGEKDNKG